LNVRVVLPSAIVKLRTTDDTSVTRTYCSASVARPSLATMSSVLPTGGSSAPSRCSSVIARWPLMWLSNR
jgi:hypothetical protein